jgi:hypothetical protein
MGATSSFEMPTSASRSSRSALTIAAAILACWLATFIVIFHWKGVDVPDDFTNEAWQSYIALAHGNIAEFLHSAPAYWGSLVLRAPFTLVGNALGSNWRNAYFWSALPCLAAPALLWGWLRDADLAVGKLRDRDWLVSPLGPLLAVNPVIWFCILLGHPEEILGGALVIAAVILAARGSTSTAVVLMCLAVFNKSWALVALPVVLAVLPAERVKGFGLTLATLAILLGPGTLFRSGVGGAAGSLGSGASGIFYPQQLWWWLGPSPWLSVHAHEFIVALSVACAAGWVLRTRRSSLSEPQRMREGMLLLALVLLLRCALDPWNNIYYSVPFLMSLYVLDLGRLPRASIVMTAGIFLVTAPLNAGALTANQYAIAYQALVVPVILLLLLRLFAPASVWNCVRRLLPSLFPANGAACRQPDLTRNDACSTALAGSTRGSGR